MNDTIIRPELSVDEYALVMGALATVITTMAAAPSLPNSPGMIRDAEALRQKLRAALLAAGAPSA
ncbi:MAG: hypothetical protein ACEQSH_00220 [Bacteroidia bacterium]|jgi:hypothetical protein